MQDDAWRVFFFLFFFKFRGCAQCLTMGFARINIAISESANDLLAPFLQIKKKDLKMELEVFA